MINKLKDITTLLEFKNWLDNVNLIDPISDENKYQLIYSHRIMCTFNDDILMNGIELCCNVRGKFIWKLIKKDRHVVVPMINDVANYFDTEDECKKTYCFM